MPSARHNHGKPTLSDVFHWPKALTAWVAHATMGRIKYPDVKEDVPNWTLGGKPDAEYINAATRHLMALRQGDIYDPETGTMHAAAVLWNMATMLQCNYGDVPVIDPVFDEQDYVDHWDAVNADADPEDEDGTRGTYEGRPGVLLQSTDQADTLAFMFDEGGKMLLHKDTAHAAWVNGVLVMGVPG